MRDRLDTVVRDLRYAVRTLSRAPGFFATVVASLALGIGATTAIFSVVYGVLLRPLPYPKPDRIVQLWQKNQDQRQTQFSDPNFVDLHARARSFDGIAQLTQTTDTSISGAGEPMRARVTVVSRDFFHVLGVGAAMGRTFAPEELTPGAPPTVVVSYSFWLGRLGGAPDVLGTRFGIEGKTFTVIGVMEPALGFPAGAELYLPRELDPPSPYRTGHNWQVVARLKDGVSAGSAQAELTTIAQGLKQEHGDETFMVDVAMVPLQEQITGSARRVLVVLLAAAALLLLIACANVVNLLLARLAVRRGEIAVRLALGAGRARLVGQLLAESFVIAAVGGGLGVLLATLGVHGLLRLEPGDLPRVSEIGTNVPVLLAALATTIGVAAALGVIGAWKGARGELREVLAEGQRSPSGSGAPHRVRDVLVVAQIALALVLLVGAGLLARSFSNLFRVQPGFRTEGVVVMDLSPPWSPDPAALAANARFYDALIARGGVLPGVRAAGAVNALPLAAGPTSNGIFIVLTRPDEEIRIEDFSALIKDKTRAGESEFRLVAGSYFRTMDIPLKRGRVFEDRDAPEATHVAVISESLAKTRWPGEDPIGKWIQYGGMDGDMHPFTIVGIVGDVREASLAAAPKPTFYASYRQRPRGAGTMNLLFRTDADPAALTASLRRLVRELNPAVPPRFRTIESVLSESMAGRRFVLVLIGAFGGAALLLATLGVYSVIAYLVTQRRREIAVRIAIGAPQGAVQRMVLRQGITLAGVGILLGAVAALGATRLLVSLLYGVAPTDPVAFLGVASVLVGVAGLASWLPARQAAGIAPAEVLRG